MPLPQMDDFTYKHSSQITPLYTGYTTAQIKSNFDSRGVELRAALNLLITALSSTEGANDIGTATIQDIDGATIQAMLQSIRDKLKSKVDGTSGADYINATAITGLTGETVQSLLESLKSYTDALTANDIEATPIASGSGSTVQAQLAWLLSQIAIAATGSIPDGSLSESKLTQTLIDKINTALSNVGVLTTLLTINKSSLVNALNEHLADNTKQIPHLGTTTNVSDAYSITTTETINANQKFTIKFNVASTSAPTLKINTGTAYAVKKANGNNAKLYASVYTLFWDGSVFTLLGEGGDYGTASASDVLSAKTIGTENGVVQGTLSLIGTASTDDVVNGKTFYNTDAKTIQTGTGVNAKRSASGDIASMNDQQQITINSLTFIPSKIILVTTGMQPTGTSSDIICYICLRATASNGATAWYYQFPSQNGLQVVNEPTTNSFTIKNARGSTMYNIRWIASE